MTVFILIMAYTIITILLGLFLGRNNKNLQQFFVAKDRLGLPLCFMLLMASSFAGAYTSGAVSESYLTGFKPFLPIVSMALGYTLFIPLVRFYRSMSREGYISIPGAFSVRFGSNVRTAILLINSLTYGALFAVQPVAFANIIAPMMGWNIKAVAWCAAVVMAAMALTGLTGIAWMNTINCFAMVGGLSIVSFMAMRAAGGITHLSQSVPSGMWNLFQPDIPSSIVRCLSLTVCMFAASEAATIAIGAKTRKAANLSLVIASIVIILFTLMLIMIGISGNVLTPDLESPRTALYSIAQSLGPAIPIVACIAVIAAIFDAPAYMIYFSTAITRDVIAVLKPNLSEKRLKLYSVFVIFGLAGFGTLLALHAQSILNLLFCVFEVQSIGGLVLIIGFYWKRVSAKSAFWSIVAGSVVSAIWMILGNPLGILPSWIVLGVGLSMLLIMTLLEKNKISDGYTRMRQIMAEYPD